MTGTPAEGPERPPVEQMPRYRRTSAPKYPVFIGLGIVLGVLVAGVVTLLTPLEPDPVTGQQYSVGKVLGYLSLVLALVGGMLGGVIAVLLDRRRR